MSLCLYNSEDHGKSIQYFYMYFLSFEQIV